MKSTGDRGTKIQNATKTQQVSANTVANSFSIVQQKTPRKNNGWNRKKIIQLKSGKSSEPNHHDCRFQPLIFQGVSCPSHWINNCPLHLAFPSQELQAFQEGHFLQVQGLEYDEKENMQVSRSIHIYIYKSKYMNLYVYIYTVNVYLYIYINTPYLYIYMYMY